MRYQKMVNSNMLISNALSSERNKNLRVIYQKIVPDFET